MNIRTLFADFGEHIGETIKEEVDKAVEDIKTNIDNIDGFDDAVEQIVENMSLKIDADNVDGLERFVEDVIENSDKEVKSGDVDGLEDFIEDKVNEMEFEVESDNVRGLEDAVKDIFDEMKFSLKVEDIEKPVMEILGKGLNVEQMLGLDELVVDCFQKPAVKSALDTAIRESLSRVLSGLLIQPIIRP